MSPVPLALAATGWFLTRSVSRHLAEQGDMAVPTPDAQYWARTLLVRAVGLMSSGLVIACAFVLMGVDFHLLWHEQVLLTVLLIAVMVTVTKLTLPGFFAASWEIYGARERRLRVRSTLMSSRVLVQAVASLILITSVIGSFALVQSLRGGSHLGRFVTIAQEVGQDVPSSLKEMSEIFSPTQRSAR